MIFGAANQQQPAFLDQAQNGTLYFDELASLDPQGQARLLELLTSGTYVRDGETQKRKCKARILGGSKLDLQREVSKGVFLEQLFDRFQAVVVDLPPLRSRRQDIPPLVDHFLDRFNARHHRKVRVIPREVMNLLQRYPWPGNVAELQHAIERAVQLCKGPILEENALPMMVRLYSYQTRTLGGEDSVESLCVRLAQTAARTLALDEGRIHSLVVDELERQLIRVALEQNDGIKVQAADWLGINRNTLNKKCRMWELD
jgi:DNA-binding NtrC family response regulator